MLNLKSILFPILILLLQLERYQSSSDNAGTVLGIAGSSFCLVACEKSLCEQSKIMSQQMIRQMDIANNIFVGTGNLADVVQLSKTLKYHSHTYRYESNCEIPLRALSNVISQELYSRRFNPYYSFSVLGGLDHNGNGALYHYDAVGSRERVPAVCSGRAEKAIQPLLDEIITEGGSEVGGNALWDYSSDSAAFESASHHQHYCEGLTEDAACELAIKAFRAARDRETSIGDSIEVWVLRNEAPNAGQNHDRSSVHGDTGILNAAPPTDEIGMTTTRSLGGKRLNVTILKKTIKL